MSDLTLLADLTQARIQLGVAHRKLLFAASLIPRDQEIRQLEAATLDVEDSISIVEDRIAAYRARARSAVFR